MTTARLGFLTFGLTYLGFLGLEYLRPGFVANVFSVHWLLLATAIFGAWWLRESSKRTSSWVDVALTTGVGAAGAVIVWIEGGTFADARLFLALTVLVLPTLALIVLRDTT